MAATPIAWIALALCLATGVAAAPSKSSPARRALLIGCTRYPSLPPEMQLAGPGNDVVLMRDTLVKRFGFPAANVTCLAEPPAGVRSPTGSNIASEFQRLIQVAQAGDQYVILMAGHGSQQPASAGAATADPDGLEEIFLPSDIGEWDGVSSVANAIVDKQLGAWLREIKSKGASIWIIVDSCHSGTMTRALDVERSRAVPASLLVPAQVLARAGKTSNQKSPPPSIVAEAPDLAAIYACQPDETTVEKALPPRSPDGKPQGLLTYAIVQILTQSTVPLSYRELTQRVHAQYIAWGRSAPTPLVEGRDIDREVLGTRDFAGRSLISLSRAGAKLQINGGALHGLTQGTVLAVRPPPGAGDALLGHVEITELRTLDAVVSPVAHAGTALRAELPAAARCEVVFLDYRLDRLKVALVGSDTAALEAHLTKRGQEPSALYVIVKSPAEADWVVKLDGSRVELASVSASSRPGGPGTLALGPLESVALPAKVDEALGRVARATRLLHLAGAPQSPPRQGSRGLAIDVELIKYANESDLKGQPAAWQAGGLSLREGETIAFALTNPNDVTVDVTLLFVDSGYGIETAFPIPGIAADNRLTPGGKVVTPRVSVNATTVGLEHIVVLVTKAGLDQPPLDFSSLAQPGVTHGRGADGAETSPLGQMLMHALHGQSGSRGLLRAVAYEHTMRLLSWQTMPAAPR